MSRRLPFLEDGRLAWPEFDPILLLLLVILPLIGVVVVSSALMPALESDSSLFGAAAMRHLAITGIGLAAALVFSLIDYHRYERVAALAYSLSVGLLVLVLLAGGSGDAPRRWIGVPWGQFQPSELAKPVLVVFLAYGAAQLGPRIGDFKWFLAGAGLAGVPLLLVALEPDLGTTVIIALTAASVGAVAGVKYWHFLALVPLVLASAGLSMLINPYQWERVVAFFSPGADPMGSSYQSQQALMALGSGGIMGKGLGLGTMKYLYLPAPHTDSIFAVAGEEFGLMGTGLILLAFLVLLVRGLWAAQQAPDKFGRCLAAGITTQIAGQAFVNMGVVTGMIPVTGIPLPFVSAGGSSLLVSLAMMGVLVNVARAGRLRLQA